MKFFEQGWRALATCNQTRELLVLDHHDGTDASSTTSTTWCPSNLPPKDQNNMDSQSKQSRHWKNARDPHMVFDFCSFEKGLVGQQLLSAGGILHPVLKLVSLEGLDAAGSVFFKFMRVISGSPPENEGSD